MSRFWSLYHLYFLRIRKKLVLLSAGALILDMCLFSNAVRNWAAGPASGELNPFFRCLEHSRLEFLQVCLYVGVFVILLCNDCFSRKRICHEYTLERLGMSQRTVRCCRVFFNFTMILLAHLIQALILRILMLLYVRMTGGPLSTELIEGSMFYEQETEYWLVRNVFLWKEPILLFVHLLSSFVIAAAFSVNSPMVSRDPVMFGDSFAVILFLQNTTLEADVVSWGIYTVIYLLLAVYFLSRLRKPRTFDLNEWRDAGIETEAGIRPLGTVHRKRRKRSMGGEA